LGSAEFKIPIGITCEEVFEVKLEHSAKNIGSGDVEVLATPSMIAFMENVAWKCVKKYLPKDYMTVGVNVEVKHLNPVPVGANVLVKANLIAVKGRKLVFKVVVFWEDIKVGEGLHERYVVHRSRFLEKIMKILEYIESKNEGYE